jgi:hypothetical protein
VFSSGFGGEGEGVPILAVVGHSCSETSRYNLSRILLASECIISPAGLTEGTADGLFGFCAREPASFVCAGNSSQ